MLPKRLYVAIAMCGFMFRKIKSSNLFKQSECLEFLRDRGLAMLVKS